VSLIDYWTLCPSSIVSSILSLHTTLNVICSIVYNPRMFTLDLPNKISNRVAEQEGVRKCGLPHIVTSFSGNFQGEANKLDTHCCDIFQWACLKQNISACLKGVVRKDLQSNYYREPWQHSSIGEPKCASTYRKLDIKRINQGTWGSNRLDLPNRDVRRRSFHSSPVIGAKGNSRSLPIKSDGFLYGVNKTKLRNRVVRPDTLTIDLKQALYFFFNKKKQKILQHHRIY
jgi:hypothetical protein